MESKRVLIVARTLAFNGLCVGAVTSRKWDPLRLLPPGRDRFWTAEEAPTKGGIYQIEFERSNVDVPHVEDVRLTSIEPIGQVRDLTSDIRANAPIMGGPLQDQFEGSLVKPAGKEHSLAVERARIPSYSTQFWRTDQDLERHEDTWDGTTKTRFETPDGIRIPWKSDQPAPDAIAAGDILRLSLATWWQNACFLQLSDAYGQ